jgi:hypothetical protein
MINTLNFKLEVPSVFDIARHVIGISLFYLEELNFVFIESSKKYFNKIVLYLSKMAVFNLDLAE